MSGPVAQLRNQRAIAAQFPNLSMRNYDNLNCAPMGYSAQSAGQFQAPAQAAGALDLRATYG